MKKSEILKTPTLNTDVSLDDTVYGVNQRQIDAQVEIFGLVGANTASGTLTITGTGYLSLTGLPFTPKYIEIYGYMASTNEWSRGSATDPALQTVLWGGVIGGVFETRQYTGTNILIIRNGTSITTSSLYSINADGFTLNTASYYGTATLLNYICFG